MLLAISDEVQIVAIIVGGISSILTPIIMVIVAHINNKIRLENAAAADRALRDKQLADAQISLQAEQTRKTLAATTIANNTALAHVAEKVEDVKTKVEESASAADRVHVAAERIEKAAEVAVAAVKACTEHPELVKRIEKLENGNGAKQASG